MESRDQIIGRNIARMRGETTQTQLAERMAARGWKWSQSTVWAVESGKRAIRYAEALDVCWILNADIRELEGDEADMDVVFMVGKYFQAIDDVRDAVRKAAEWQYDNAKHFDTNDIRKLDPEHVERALGEIANDSIGETISLTLRQIAREKERELDAVAEGEGTALREGVISAWRTGLGG